MHGDESNAADDDNDDDAYGYDDEVCRHSLAVCLWIDVHNAGSVSDNCLAKRVLEDVLGYRSK